jgi:enoyl-[acyl-carrier-protein] reductase (NADH)
MAKSAMLSLARSLATGLGPRGIRVEIPDAVVFLVSPMAPAITSQRLDVNCGEFHH